MKRELNLLDLEQTRACLVVAANDRLAALFTVAIALGLRWADIDLAGGHLAARRSLQRVVYREASLVLPWPYHF